MKLISMEREEDLDSVIAKLTDVAANLNIQRFQTAIEIKVDLLWEFVGFCSFKSDFKLQIKISMCWQNLLIKAVSFR